VFADIRPEKIRTADGKKTQSYLQDGMVVGGDRAISDAIVRDIRRAANPAGFERIVVDLQGSSNGEIVAIPRPPFFQTAINADEKRIIITIYGHPKLSFDAKKVLAAFSKSPVVSSVLFYPVLEEDAWTFVLELKEAFPVEVFELTHPVRIILDVKRKKVATQMVPAQAKARSASKPVQQEQSAIEPESESSGEE